ncbi:hypothetical protein SAMN05421874_1183 [Nonomuraea maritima]|uniref:Uncharacterized protein n=1 Tax=Nonomuraea maritima TaxID=683260 RepID=A0A1G9ID59_9ACTN|nr:hypothetical protein SAMN05421874_1183 [Nonomuraea maritima]
MALSTPRRCRRSRSCVGPSWWFRCPSRHAVVAGSLGAAGFIGAIESQVGLRWLCCFAGRAAPLGAAEQVALWTPRRYRLSRLGAGLAVPVPAEAFRGGRCAERGWFYSPDRVVREVGAAGPAFSLAGQHLSPGWAWAAPWVRRPYRGARPRAGGELEGGDACHELPWRSSPLCAAGSIPAIESSQRWPCSVAGKAVPSARRSGRCCGHRCPSGEQGPGAGGSGAHPGWPWCPVRWVRMAPLLVRGSAVTAGWRRWEGPANVGSRRGGAQRGHARCEHPRVEAALWRPGLRLRRGVRRVQLPPLLLGIEEWAGGTRSAGWGWDLFWSGRAGGEGWGRWGWRSGGGCWRQVARGGTAWWGGRVRACWGR